MTEQPVTDDELKRWVDRSDAYADIMGLPRAGLHHRIVATIDALRAQLTTAQAERDEWKQTAHEVNMRNEAAKAALQSELRAAQEEREEFRKKVESQAIETGFATGEMRQAIYSRESDSRAIANLHRKLDETAAELRAARVEREEDARTIEQLTRSVHAVKDADIRSLREQIAAKDAELADERAFRNGSQELAEERRITIGLLVLRVAAQTEEIERLKKQLSAFQVSYRGIIED